MKKRCIGILLALALTLTLALTCAQAGSRVELGPIEGGSAAAAVSGEEDAALLEGYLYQLNGLQPPEETVTAVSGGLSASAPATYALAMNNATQIVYDGLASAIREIAAGTRDSSIITVEGPIAVYTRSDLGNITIIENNDYTDAAMDKIKESFGADLNLDVLLQNLLTRMPYELYWFDKTEGIKMSYTLSSDGNSVTITGVAVQMYVSVDYAVTEGNTYYPLYPDTTRTRAASAAAANAANVVAQCAGMRPYDRLAAYRDYITEAVSYNDEAAKEAEEATETTGYAYGDPWQLIYVFDDNPETNVVCEGYAKAFQYLCDLTWTGSDPAVKCYSVTGWMDTEPHMWNIVTLENANYLTDVTNCDTGAVGAPDKLFLCGAAGGRDAGYTVAIPGQNAVKYTYDEYITQVYDQELVLSETGYTPFTYDAAYLMKLTRHVAHIEPMTGSDLANADVNNDGKINAADMTALARQLAA